MREIKFRAWDGKQFIPVCINAEGKPCVIIYPGQQIIQDNCQQFTGLKDKNGKDVYEGDIVEFKDKVILSEPLEPNNYKINKSVISWDDNEAKFTDGHSNFGWVKSSEVIGNVFENK